MVYSFSKYIPVNLWAVLETYGRYWKQNMKSEIIKKKVDSGL